MPRGKVLFRKGSSALQPSTEACLGAKSMGKIFGGLRTLELDCIKDAVVEEIVRHEPIESCPSFVFKRCEGFLENDLPRFKERLQAFEGDRLWELDGDDLFLDVLNLPLCVAFAFPAEKLPSDQEVFFCVVRWIGGEGDPHHRAEFAWAGNDAEVFFT